jgi:putative hydrolase of the HAD superfamily
MGRGSRSQRHHIPDRSMDWLNSIQAVSFDVGGTLIEPHPSVGHVYAEVAIKAGLASFDPDLLNARFSSAWRGKVDFDYSRRAWAEIVLKTFAGGSETFGASSPFFHELYERFAQADAWRLYDDVFPALEALTGRGLKLAVVSNWDDRLRLLLRNLQLDRFFHAIEVSGEIGFHKPAPEIFQRAVQALGVPARTVLHVGDSPIEDLEGAERAGLRALLINRKARKAAGTTISSLLELNAFLRA